MPRRLALLACLLLAGCGSHSEPSALIGGPSLSGPPSASAGASVSASPSTKARPFKAGNPNGKAVVPADARAADASKPDRVVGKGTAASCTSEALVAAVGVITFACGPDPVTIIMKATAKVRNAHPRLVLDGGGLVALSGGGKRRILYMNTCDRAQGWTTPPDA